MKVTIAVLAGAIALSGCTGMSDTQQRALTGTAGGAAAGAAIGAMAGNAGLGAAIGAGAGLVGGLIYDRTKKNEQSAYDQGYAAGHRGGAAQPPQ